jgi:hypothetical protein
MRTSKQEKIQVIVEYLKAKSIADNETNLDVLIENAREEPAFEEAWSHTTEYQHKYIHTKLTHQLGKLN